MECPLGSVLCATLLRKQTNEVRRFVKGVRAHQSEGIHDMRVASRRLRATLDEFSGLFSPTLHAMARKRVRNLTRLLGTARELDVCVARLASHAGQWSDPQRQAVDAVTRFLLEKRRELDTDVEAAAVAASSPAFREKLQELVDFMIMSPGCCLRVASKRLPRQFVSLCSAYRLWCDTPTDDGLHEIRIGVKQLRYACETYEPLYGAPLHAWIEELKRAQEALGDWNDYRILQQYILSVGKEPSLAGVYELAAAIGAEMAVHLERFKSESATLFVQKTGRRFKLALGKPIMPCCMSSPD